MARAGRNLRRQLRHLIDDLERELAGEVEREAWTIRRDERSWVPVLTGELRAGIEYQIDHPLHATVGVFDRSLWWAVFIEYGRKNAAARPFVTPAREESRRRWPRRVERAVRRVLP